MWKREGTADAVPGQMDAPQAAPRAATPRTPGERATIGRSIVIRGEVTGDEDLLVQGKIEGSIILPENSIVIGPEGDVKADVSGRVVTVEGRVEGNLTADEQVVLRSASIVQGDITAPRVVLEDGARFRGGVDMGESKGGGQRKEPAAARGGAAPQPERQKPSTEGANAPAVQATP